MARPLCRYCGKPLPKATERFWCYLTEPTHIGSRKDYVVGTFRNKEALQRVTNREITSVTYHLNNEHHRERGLAGTISSFSTWDGESYLSVYGAGFFCANTCAIHFANYFARRGEVMLAWLEASRDQHTKEK
jgi:hypothetical protein